MTNLIGRPVGIYCIYKYLNLLLALEGGNLSFNLSGGLRDCMRLADRQDDGLCFHVGVPASCPPGRVPQALPRWGAGILPAWSRAPGVGPRWGAGILPASSRAPGVGPRWGAGILPAWSSVPGVPSAIASAWGQVSRLNCLCRPLFLLLIILSSAVHTQSAGAR